MRSLRTISLVFSGSFSPSGRWSRPGCCTPLLAAALRSVQVPRGVVHNMGSVWKLCRPRRTLC